MYLEDYRLYQEFEVPPIEIKKEELIAFAKEYDPRPFHLDEKEAEKTRFGKLFASGFHTLALCWGSWVRMKIDEEGMIAGIGLEELRWKKPVFVGDTLYPVVKIQNIVPSEDGLKGRVEYEMRVRNQHDEEVLRVVGIGLVASKRSKNAD